MPTVAEGRAKQLFGPHTGEAHPAPAAAAALAGINEEPQLMHSRRLGKGKAVGKLERERERERGMNGDELGINLGYKMV